MDNGDKQATIDRFMVALEQSDETTSVSSSPSSRPKTVIIVGGHPEEIRKIRDGLLMDDVNTIILEAPRTRTGLNPFPNLNGMVEGQYRAIKKGKGQRKSRFSRENRWI